ncbi:MAG: hypothetical protein NT023_20360 [Armatimonadetes bacterium]|nr:hypothetical protein [Armatimonadota bacterium]
MERFNRTIPVPEVAGTEYSRFKEFVRADFEKCCAYCYLHEEHIGGLRHFELDHFCPRKHCPDAVDDYYNLYWCCHGCNKPGSKHAHWPSKELLELGYGFVDFCADRFEEHYEILPDGELKALTLKAKYTIRHIGLNCEGLKTLRCRLCQQGQPMDSGYAVANK